MTVIPMPQTRSRPAPEPGDDIPGPPLPEEVPDEARLKKKKDKVRSAWISFAGRIVAQIVGAAATVTLTLAVVHRVQPAPERPAAADNAGADIDLMRSTPSRAAAADRSGPSPGSAAVPSPPTVAVLPLENFSGDGAQRAFADAMTETLVAGLAQVEGLNVISRTSSMQYRDAHVPLPAIARALGATHVVEGSVVRDGSRVRVTAQLIEAASDRHLWARAYDRPAADPLRVEAELAGLIAREVRAILTQPAGETAGDRSGLGTVAAQ